MEGMTGAPGLALAEAIRATEEAGFQLPIRTERGRYLGGSWDILEADGTRLAVVGCEPDAQLIVAALNYVLDPANRMVSP